MANANVSLQILPVVEENKLYGVIDKVIEFIEKSNVKYEVGPMETTMEGELSKLLNIVEEAHNICIKAGTGRVVSVIKIDYKPEGITMAEKTNKYR